MAAAGYGYAPFMRDGEKLSAWGERDYVQAELYFSERKQKLSKIWHLMQIWENLHEMPCTDRREYATI